MQVVAKQERKETAHGEGIKDFLCMDIKILKYERTLLENITAEVDLSVVRVHNPSKLFSMFAFNQNIKQKTSPANYHQRLLANLDTLKKRIPNHERRKIHQSSGYSTECWLTLAFQMSVPA